MSFLDKLLTGVATSLRTLTTNVDIASSPAPTNGQVLTALDATHAQWISPSGSAGGIAIALATTGGDVNVSGAPPPTTGQILTADDATAASWVDPSWLPLAEFSLANTVLCCLAGDGGLGPTFVVVPPSTMLMRAAAGDIFAGTAADVATLLSGQALNDSASVSKTLFDANTVLASDVDNSPYALTLGPSTILARLATGPIVAATPGQLKSLLSLNNVSNDAQLKRAASDFSTFTLKSAPVAADLVLLENASDGSKVYAPLSALQSAIGAGGFSAFAWASNAATLALGTAKNWAASNTLTGNSTLTLTGGADGDSGAIYVKQDATGARTLAFTVSGRTIMRDANATDDNPQAVANSFTAYHFQLFTLVSVAYIRITKVFLT